MDHLDTTSWFWTIFSLHKFVGTIVVDVATTNTTSTFSYRPLRQFTVIMTSSSHDATTLLPPVPPEVVAQYVAPLLYHKYTDGEATRFAVAGSYPAAVKAYQTDPTWLLPYNDVDVWVQAGDTEYAERSDEVDERDDDVSPPGGDDVMFRHSIKFGR